MPVLAKPLNKKLELVEGSSHKLRCTVVIGTPTPTISWHHNSRPKLPRGAEVNKDGNLALNRIGKHMEGSYECIASNIAGNTSIIMDVSVLSKL